MQSLTTFGFEEGSSPLPIQRCEVSLLITVTDSIQHADSSGPRLHINLWIHLSKLIATV